MADDALAVAVVGVGRIGVFHARHVQELGAETGACRLVAVVDRHGDTASRVAQELGAQQESPVQAFTTPEGLAQAGVARAAVIASRTEHHRRDATALIEAGMRVLLEKPLADSLDESRAFVAWLDQDAVRRRAVMLAFQRRHDAALLRAKELLDQGAIGRLFKLVSVLEDPAPPPDGYQSPGLLSDMAVHNADEVLWLSGKEPSAVSALGVRLYNQKIPGVVVEDFDDALLQVWLQDDVVAQIQVSRNHVSGYRNEVVLFGERGLIRVGPFDEDRHRVRLEAYGPGHAVIEKSTFALRDYGRPVPVFIDRFGPAYKAEVAAFVAACRRDASFAVTHRDGLRAMEVVAAGTAGVRTRAEADSLR